MIIPPTHLVRDDGFKKQYFFNGDVQVHSLVQEKMEGISIEVL